MVYVHCVAGAAAPWSKVFSVIKVVIISDNTRISDLYNDFILDIECVMF